MNEPYKKDTRVLRVNGNSRGLHATPKKVVLLQPERATHRAVNASAHSYTHR